MPRKSRSEILESSMVDQLQAIIDDPSSPGYVKIRAMGTLTTLLRRRDRRLELKAKAAAARRAERDEAERYSRPYVSHLPDNGRMIRD
jgi:hypothetical protein